MKSISIYTESANLTDEQFFMLSSQNKELRIERDKNKMMILSEPAGSYTGMHSLSCSSLLWNWNKKSKLGYAFDSSAGFTLPNEAVRAPDAAWISKKRYKKIPQEDKERFTHICPDFVIEVRSKSDSLKLLHEKMQEWIDNGCFLAWLIDFKNEKVHIYKPGRKIISQNFDKLLNGEDVLPGFVLDLKEIL